MNVIHQDNNVLNHYLHMIYKTDKLQEYKILIINHH